MINALLDDARGDKPLARTGGVVARVTPYAFVVAEMRGAKVELLATCNSRSTGRTVTNAFMVVPQSSFAGPAPPTLEQVLAHLKKLSEDERPARFIYHNKYSTSSYFLPSLLFRARRVFGLGDRDIQSGGRHDHCRRSECLAEQFRLDSGGRRLRPGAERRSPRSGTVRCQASRIRRASTTGIRKEGPVRAASR